MNSSPTRPRRVWRNVNGIFVLDKPLGLSSNQALQQVRRLFNAAKAGHTGSLDPLATGVLPLCFGEATKLCSVLLDADKTYVARVRVGFATTTGDAEGEPIRETDVRLASAAQLEAVRPRFVGTIEQVPPMYSALKRDGVPLYELARAGLEVARSAREVTIHELELLGFEGDQFEFRVRCSKGTYVRTLAEDWAAAIGQAAHLSALRRTALGALTLDAAITLDALQRTAANAPAALERLLLAPVSAVARWPQLVVTQSEAGALAMGRSIARAGLVPAPRLAVLDTAGALLGLAEIAEDGRVQPRRWLNPASPEPAQPESGSLQSE
jgi:tRNA pseudouridine55 synthase